MPTHSVLMPRFLFLAMSVALAVGGCATTREIVDRRMILPMGADQHDVRENQLFVMAVPIEQPMPEFPRSVQDQDGLYEVCVEFVVTEVGTVEQLVFPTGQAECEQPSRDIEVFQRAVAAALSRWSFFGAAICTFPDDVTMDEKCESEGATVRAIPIKLMYVFSFKQVKGRRSVGIE